MDADTVRAEMQEAVTNYYKQASTYAENSTISHAETAAVFLSLAKYSQKFFDDRYSGKRFYSYIYFKLPVHSF